MLARCTLSLSALLVATLVLPAAELGQPRPFDWPQWQGKNRTAVSSEKGLLETWPKDGPKLVWKSNELGKNYCTPTVAAGRIFLMGNRDNNEHVIALAEDTGKELWHAVVGKVRANGGGYPGPRCSPTVDGDLVYAIGLNGDLVCLNASDGSEKWRKDFAKDFKGAGGGWGYCESPLVDGDLMLCTPGGRTNTIVALDKKTGDLVWKAVVPQGDGAAYSSIITAKIAGEKQYVQFLNGGVVGISARGDFLWRYNKPANGTANCSTPIASGDFVFAASGYETGGGLARIAKEDQSYTAKEVYFTRKMRNQHGGMVLIDGYIYGSDEGNLTCIELETGKIMWAERKAGKGSISCADGKLYYRNEGGPVILVDVNPKEYIERGRFKPPQSGSPTWPHPVIANGRLYIQDQDVLLCYDVKQ